MSNFDYHSAYVRAKFEYLCLKFNQTNQPNQLGGYSENSPVHVAAAAIAVINCTYFGTNQESVDCVDNTSAEATAQKKAQLETEIAALGTSIKDRTKRMELTSQLNSLNTVKTDLTNISNISNRTCDKILATVASIYLSILFNSTKNTTNTDTFSTALNDLMNKKIINCKSEKRTPEKIKQIIKYYLNVINKINEYLENIGTPNGVSYVDIFTNAEYGKSDKKVIEKLREKGLEISAADEENFRMVNDFIGSNLQHVKKISVHDILAKLKINSQPIETLLVEELKKEYPNVNSEIDVANMIVFGVYTYDRPTNKTTVSNQITQSVRLSRKL